MVARPLGAARFATVIETLAGDIEGLSVQGYKGTDSDGWAQNQRLNTGDATAHLEFALWLGSVVSRDATWDIHAAEVRFVHRYNPDTDAESQAQVQAAAYHIATFLDEWAGLDGSRVLDLPSFEVELLGPDWFGVTVPFQLCLIRS